MTRFEPGRAIKNIEGVLFFYTRQEAAAHAKAIGWPQNSAKRFTLPFGFKRWALSDPHGCVLLKKEEA